VGMGRRMELYKEVGLPAEVAKRFDLASMAGTHAIGHTRMATESAVTTDGAHPYSTGPDQCLVHNGSLSNHNSLRRELRRDGIGFATENDTEVAAGYLTWRLRQGMDLGAALESALADLDGFYTFVVGTESGFGVLRDPIACKPAVMAETDDYVAFGTEYRALADLPGVERARVFEPEPAKVYFWDLKQ
ncbi:MAG: glutamine amidotransferase, partial [Stellaceae bacterium]